MLSILIENVIINVYLFCKFRNYFFKGLICCFIDFKDRGKYLCVYLLIIKKVWELNVMIVV